MKTPLALLVVVLLLVGVGCIRSATSTAPNTIAQSAPEVEREANEGSAIGGLYKDWNRIVIEEAIALHIPPTCIADTGRETAIIVCPTRQNPTPTPAMYITFHGDGEIQVLRWEGMEWEGWDDVVASIQILAPLTQELQLTIQE